MGNWLTSIWEGVSRSRDPDTGKFASPDGWDWNRLIEEMGKTQAELLNLAASGGHIFIKDIVPQNETDEEVSNKVWIDIAGETVLESCTTSTLDIEITILSSFPMCKIGDTEIELDISADEGHYSKTINYTLNANATDITVNTLLPNGTLGFGYTVELEVVAGPTLLTLQFTGGYPGSQTQLKAGDTFQILGTTDVICNAVKITDFGACVEDLQTFPATNSFVVTGTIADRGTSTQDLAAKVQARNAAGAFGPLRATNQDGGTTDGYHLVKLNNQYPEFTDNGYINTTSPGDLAFNGTDAGTQETAVSNKDTVVYTSPHGDFTIIDPSAYAAIKNIDCTNPGDYNDSETNFRITANRAANDATAIFDKTIEVADTAPTLTVTQPQARLRSAATYTITVTSDQNLAAAPNLNVVVGGTWQGAGFVAAPGGQLKIWTRDILIAHADSRGTAAWTQAVITTNRASVNTGITGDQIVGGFEQIEVTFDHNPDWDIEPISTLSQVSCLPGNPEKLVCEDNAGHALAYQATKDNNPYTFTITDSGGNLDDSGDYIYWCDDDAVGANVTGTAYLKIEEIV